MMGIKSVFAGAPEESDTPSLPSITIDQPTLHEVLQNERRQLLITNLVQCGELTVSDAAEIVAAKEYGKTTDELDSDERKNIYVAIYQTHAPKLAEHGLINYDEDAGVLAANPLTEAIDQIQAAIGDATVDGGDA